MKLFIAPHNDDEGLFGAFTLMREHPLVAIVTDSYIQFNRGENCTAEDRWQESLEAVKILGCSAIRLGIRDDLIDERFVKDRLSMFGGFEEIYAPAVQGGNPHHDLIGRIAKELFPECKQYTTYAPGILYTTGSVEIVPTQEELAKKFLALSKYTSQLRINKQHFDAVAGRSEWLI